MRIIRAADLFAGAGGTSTALAMAARELGLKLKLTAVNHWPVAVETHAANHPDADHLCESLDSVDPRKACPGRLDILVASPECTGHSNARGGKPADDQSRSSAMHVVRWAEAKRPSVILVENVREFLGWGPLGVDGRPLKSKKGIVFDAWVNMLQAIGYRVSWRLVNAADFGGATTRTRLFVVAVRGRGPVPWAEPTHARDPRPDLFGTLKPWRAAREVVDLSLPSRSIFDRKRPLKPNTVARIAEGIRRFWGMDPEPFLVRLRGTSVSHLATSALPLSGPLPTLTAGRNIGICEPFIVPQFSTNGAREIGRPLGGITTTSRGMGLVEPFLMNVTHQGDHVRRVRDLDSPLPTITAASRGEHALIEPFIVPTNFGEREGQRPRTHSYDSPLPTIVGSNTLGVVEPFLVSYHGNDSARSLADPLATLTTRDRFGLVTPSGAIVADILFRMLQPGELAAGMGFPAGYLFKGNREDVVKQIGNAVEVNKAKAHLRELLLSLAG